MDPVTRTLVVGDSHIRRFADYLDAPPNPHQHLVNLGFGIDAEVSLIGHGGRTAKTIGTLDFGKVQALLPHVIILMVGGNDLCDPNSSPLTVATNIFDLAVTLEHSDLCEYVIVTSIPTRLKYPALSPSFPSRVSQCNHFLRHLLEPERRLQYWKHYGLANPVTPSFLRDGIHLNDTGMLKLYRSMRGAVLKGHRVMDLLRGGLVNF